MAKEVVLTGLRSNAEFHLGNYLGAIMPMVELQKKHAGQYQMNMFIPDLHSFTTPIDHGTLYEQSLQNLKVFAAAGLDIDQSDTFIYRQSYIPAHSELTWILDCFATFGEVSRMNQFKDKSSLSSAEKRLVLQNVIKAVEDAVADDVSLPDTTTRTINKHYRIITREAESAKESSTTVGLFNYPVLMAADILLYGAKWVPVGEDQRQHVEFARELANRLNNRFENIFIMPEDNVKQTEFAGHSEPIRIRSLRNPENKMSKSVEDPAGTIMLSDSPEEAAQKVMAATTDSLNKIAFDWEKQPGVANLLQILALLSNRTQSEVNGEWEGKQSYGELKTAVGEVVKVFLTDLQARLAVVDEKKIMEKLASNEEAMSKVADQTLLKVQRAVGLRPKR